MKSDAIDITGFSVAESIPPTENVTLAELQRSLGSIKETLDGEITAKQQTIERQELEIQQLHEQVKEKEKRLVKADGQLIDAVHKNEGHRQLINKLLNDIDRLNQDIEWYKRTYETRSFMGTIKTKFLKK